MAGMGQARSSGRFHYACVASLALAGCGTGTSRIEAMLDAIHPVDVAVVGGIVIAVVGSNLIEPDLAWRSSIAETGAGRYRISIVRAFWSGVGEGEMSGRFGREAERIAAARSCTRFKVLSYQERYEAQNFGSQKVGEGVIQCE